MKKCSGDVVSAVCYTIYTIHQCLCTQTVRRLFVNSLVGWQLDWLSGLHNALANCHGSQSKVTTDWGVLGLFECSYFHV